MSTPPRWDLTPIFPELDSPAFEEAREGLSSGVTRLASLLDERMAREPTATTVDDVLVVAFESIVEQYEALLEVGWTVESYVLALVDTDAGDQAAARVESQIRAPLAERRRLGRQLAGWLNTVDLDELIAQSSVAQDRAFPLKRLRDQATYAMPDELERLAADLHPVASVAWSRLRGQVLAGIRVELEVADRVEEVPLSALRAMAADPDRTTRERAYRAEVAALAAHGVPLVAALNGVTGESVILARRREWETPLDHALEAQGLERSILDALLAATRAALPDLRRFLRLKARALRVEQLAWFDLAAPIGDPPAWTFGESADLVADSFARFSPALGELARRAIDERWIDAEPRAGKQGGGLCYWAAGGMTPIRIEFLGGYDGVRMLAHELGHAYHTAILARADRPPLQVEAAPAPLMETASKLCEELVRRDAVERARSAGDAGSELALLDGFLTGARRSVVDALTNFLFEERVYQRRADGELSIDEINGLMNALRGEMYGDALDPDSPFPWTWAVQPHLYLDGQPFYNLPYLFGQLLALGLTARQEADPAGFPAQFDAFLADVGRSPTEELGRAFGIDLRSTAFWAEGLAVIGREIDRYEALVADR